MARPRPRVMPDLKGWIVQPMHTDVIVCNSIFKKKKKNRGIGFERRKKIKKKSLCYMFYAIYYLNSYFYLLNDFQFNSFYNS
jgi:hypothetical protein